MAALRALVTALLLVLGVTCAAALQVNLLSDMHFDPAFGTSSAYGTCTSSDANMYGTPGCDTSLFLSYSLSSDVSQQSSAYTMFAGNWQRHDMANSGYTVANTFTTVAQVFKSMATTSAMPKPRFIGCVGADDFVPASSFDYSATSHADLNTEVAILQQSQLLTASEASTMASCGFYSRIATDNLRVVVLNSLVWTYGVSPAVPDSVADPCGQLAFLQAEIAAARSASQRVVVLGSTPPTVNVSSVVARGSLGAASADMLWKPAYQQAYTAIVAASADVVSAQIYGATSHFAVVADAAVGVPLYVLGSISPAAGVVPSYMVGDFDGASWKLTGLRQRRVNTDFGYWTAGSDVPAALGIADLTSFSAVQSALEALLTNDTTWANYQALRTGGTATESCSSTFCRAATVCAMQHTSHDAYSSCVAASLPTTTTTTTTAEPTSTTTAAPVEDARFDSEPIYHIRPPHNWINDPNGPYRDAKTGTIHLYMQYNPYGALWGNISWFHVTSEDYAKWKQPEPSIALHDDSWYDAWGAYSGTMVNDADGVPIVIYTCAEPENIQRQCIANIPKSDLNGKRTLNTFVKSPLNPVLTEDDVPGLVGLGNFRDPTEYWVDPAHPDRWLVAFVARINDTEGDNAHVVLFSTKDPTFQSGYTFSHSLYMYKYDAERMFECPDFFTVDGGSEHFLKITSMVSRRDYMIYGSYELDPTSGEYVYVEDPTRSFTFIDYGPFYASKSFYDPILKRRMLWGWTKDDLSDAQIEAQGWSGVQNLLRGMAYDATEKKIRTYPIPELRGLRKNKIVSQKNIAVASGGSPTVLVPAGGDATRYHEIIVTFTIDPTPFSSSAYYTEDSAPEFGVMVRANADHSKHTTVSVKMPAATAEPIANAAESGPFAIMKTYPVADDSKALGNCSAQCARDRTCESWTLTSRDAASGTLNCIEYWHTNPRVHDELAQSGTVNEPHLYFGRDASGTIGGTETYHGRAPLTQAHPNKVELHIFVDDSVVEVFKDGGLETLSARVYLPKAESQTGISLFARNMPAGSVTAEAVVYTMDTLWAPPSPPGVVRNFTNSLYDLLTSILN